MTPEQWIAALGAGAVILGGVGTIVKMALDHRSGVRSRAADSEERHMARLEKRLEQLEATQTRLESTLRRRDAYIADLLAFIALYTDGSPVPQPTEEP